MNILDGFHMHSLLQGNNRQQRPICAKTISSLVRKVFGIAHAHLSPGAV